MTRLACALPLLVCLAVAAPDERRDLSDDPLPPGAIARLGTVRYRAEGACEHVVWSPAGDVLASSGRRGVVLWEAATGKRLRTIPPREEPGRKLLISPTAPAFAPDGQTLLVGYDDGVVHLHDLRTGQVTTPLQTDYSLDMVGFTTGGTAVLAVGQEGLVAVERRTGKELLRLAVRRYSPSEERPRGRPREYFGLAKLAPDGSALVISVSQLTPEGNGGDSAWHLYALPNGRLLASYSGGCTPAFSPTGRYLALRQGNRVTIATTATGKLVRSFTLIDPERWPWEEPTTFCLDATNPRITSWLGPQLGRLPHWWERLGYGAICPHFRRVAFPCGSRLELRNLADGAPLHPIVNHEQPIESLAYAPDGRTLYSGGNLRTWDAASGRLLAAHPQYAEVVLPLPDGRHLLPVATGTSPRLLDLATGKLTQTAGRFLSGTLANATLTADGTRLLIVSGVGLAQLCDVATGKVLCEFGERIPLSGGDWFPAVLSLDGKRVALADYHGTLTLHDAASGKLVHRLYTPQEHEFAHTFTALAFSPDGRILASRMHRDRHLRLWDVATGERIADTRKQPFPDMAWNPRVLSFSADGRTLACLDGYGSLYLFETDTGRLRHRLEQRASAVAFPPRGPTFATAAPDGTALVWDPRLLFATNKAVADLWADLAGDAEVAYRASHALAARPAEALPLFRDRLQPVATPEPQRLARWLRDLDADDFDTREQALQELAALGEVAWPALRAVQNPRPEQRRRIDELLARRPFPVTGERLRVCRAIESLEALGAAGVPLLERLATGTAASLITQRAQAALKRLTP